MGIRILHKVAPVLREYWPDLVFAAVAIAALWQALLPGYVLTLDMIWTPHVYLQASHEGYWYLAPWQALLWLAHLVVPVWLIQKVVLLGTLIGIAESAYRFLPVPGGRLPRFAAAMFYLLNPFVYTRFLAGHQLVLAAYALLPVILWLSFRTAGSWRARDAAALGLLLAFIGSLSPHLLVVAGVLALIVGIACTIPAPVIRWRVIGKAAGVAAATLVLASAYWLVPLALRGERLDQQFDRTHLRTFSAASRPGFPLSADLLWLGGFWGEHREWSLQYRWPQDAVPARAAAGALAVLIGYGAVSAWRGAVRKRVLAATAGAGIIAYVLASGVSLPVFAPLNEALFRLVPFWSGFRDSAKWIGLLAPLWALLLGTGFAAMSTKWPRRRQAAGVAVLCVLIWVACYPMLPGFWGRVRAVQYPDAWERVKEMMDTDAPGERTLFLPWHRYFVSHLGGRLDFPAYFYYGPRAVTNRNPEIGGVGDTETDPGYRAIDRLLTGSANAAEAVRILREQGIVRVVLFTDLADADPLAYRFLADRRFTRGYADPVIRVFGVPEISPK